MKGLYTSFSLGAETQETRAEPVRLTTYRYNLHEWEGPLEQWLVELSQVMFIKGLPSKIHAHAAAYQPYLLAISCKDAFSRSAPALQKPLLSFELVPRVYKIPIPCHFCLAFRSPLNRRQFALKCHGAIQICPQSELM